MRQAAHHRGQAPDSLNLPRAGWLSAPGAPGFTNAVQLPQIAGEIPGTGPKSKKVDAEMALLRELRPDQELASIVSRQVGDAGWAGPPAAVL